jgi:hypothetical protein
MVSGLYNDMDFPWDVTYWYPRYYQALSLSTQDKAYKPPSRGWDEAGGILVSLAHSISSLKIFPDLIKVIHPL